MQDVKWQVQGRRHLSCVERRKIRRFDRFFRKQRCRETQTDVLDWRVTIRPDGNEVAFVFPKGAETTTMLPYEIVVETETESKTLDSAQITTTVDDMTLHRALSADASISLLPDRSDSPEMSQRISATATATAETDWLSERASVALNDLLQSLKIDPQILSKEPSPPPSRTKTASETTSPVDCSLLTCDDVLSPKEGTISLPSHHLSTCSIENIAS